MDESTTTLRPDPPRVVCARRVMTMPEGTYDLLLSADAPAESLNGTHRVTIEVIGGCPFPGPADEEERCYLQTRTAHSLDEAVRDLHSGLLCLRAKHGAGWLPKQGPTHQHADGVVLADLDGVVNHEALYVVLRERGRPAPPRDWIDPACVARLDRVCDEGRAALVITSAWPIYLGCLGLVEEALRAAGLRTPIVGACPTSFPPGSLPPEKNDRRWRVICRWLGDHPNVTRWVIIDDCRWLGFPSDHTVATELSVGLTDDDVSAAIEILGGGPPPRVTT